MLFSSLEFLLLFLPLTLAVALRLRGQPLLRWIALSSVIFYAFAGHWWFIVPMLVTTMVDYRVAIAIERARGPRRRGWLLAVSLAGNLGMLGAGRGTGWGWAPLHALVYRWARFKDLFSYTVLKASAADLERAARGRGRRGAEWRPRCAAT